MDRDLILTFPVVEQDNHCSPLNPIYPSTHPANTMEDTLVVVNENRLHDEGPSIDPTVATVLSSIGMAVSLIVLLVAAIKYINHQEDSAIPKKGLIGIMLAMTSILISMVLYFVYSILVKTPFDYLGPMRITQVRFQEQADMEVVDEKDHYHFYYDAAYDLDWGFEWACPGMSEGTLPKQCHSSLKVEGCSATICSKRVCTEQERQAALQEVELCVQQENLFDMDANYTRFDPLMGPSQDDDWPHIDAFGDCDSCRVISSLASSATLGRLKIAGAVFVLVGIYILLLLCYYGCGADSKREGQPQEKESQDQTQRTMDFSLSQNAGT
ncbi:expressed unknown protein [Seminavis robusta]|uniref:Uncharacterized protein n=1 Tax=Seminavis robusta TaxID=568900 RepID=A0A9N8ELR6_9STRA|nr:expressed unknown protein [Seminavis robusta]|eukprot:Sro1141_g245610.1 n/a (326) ;mRNA; f:9580-10557